MKKISIIIVTYNSEELIYNCIESIYKYNDINKEIEIIVVDNNSKNVDSMFFEIEKKFGKEIILIKNEINGGYGQGNNVGIKVANGEIIMIMNPDVRLIMPIFKKVLDGFTQKNVVMVGMKQMISKTQKGQSLLYMSNTIIGIFENKFYSIFDLFIQSKMCFSGSCFFLKKLEFVELGLFDEKIFMYGEELDIHKRFTNSSRKNKMLYLSKLKYIHFIIGRLITYNSEINQFKSFMYLCNKYNLNFKNECKKRIRLYKLIRLKTIIISGNVEVLDNSIKLFQEHINTELNG